MSKMKNKAAAIFANPIPYCKALRKVTGSVTGAILMQQLEYWFHQKPDGFYKYLEPLKGADGKLTKYKEGDSWVEELGFSKDEFRAAFDKIGHRFKSKKDMKLNLSQSETRLYYSYFDKMKGETWYFRNHELVDQRLDELIYGDWETQFTEIGKPNTPILGNPTPNITETTSETTSDNIAAAALISPNFGKETKTKVKQTIDLSPIEPVVKILREENKHADKSISINLRNRIRDEIETNGEDYVCNAVRGRIAQAKATGKELWLTAFFDPDRAEWRATCAEIGERLSGASEGLQMAFKSTLPDFSHIKYDDAPIDEEAWQTLTGSKN